MRESLHLVDHVNSKLMCTTVTSTFAKIETKNLYYMIVVLLNRVTEWPATALYSLSK